MLAGALAERTITRSQTPLVYVPRRIHIAPLEGVPQGAAIVGTPQGDGTVAIDVQSTPYVEPTPERWTTWVAEAALRHSTDEQDRFMGEPETRIVYEGDLMEIGRFEEGMTTIGDEAGGAQLTRWIEAGRTAYVVDGYVPAGLT